MAPLAFTKENFDQLRRDLVDMRGQLLSITKANTRLAKEKAELRALVNEMKEHLHDRVVSNVLGGSDALEKLALSQIKKWVGRAIKALDKIF